MALNNPEKRYQSADLAYDPDGRYLRTASSVDQSIPDANTGAEIAALYDISGIAPNDFVVRKTTSNGQVITALSLCPLSEDASSTIKLNGAVPAPCSVEAEFSMSQRARHDFASLDLYEDAATGPRALPADIEIASIYQSSADLGVAYNAVAGTIVTIVLSQPFMGYLSDWIHVYGLVDNRLNYPNLCVKYISYDRKTLTAGFSDETALPSLAVAAITPPAGTAKIKHYHNMAGADNGLSYRFTAGTATNAALVSLFGGNDVSVSGTLVGDHRTTIASTNPVYNSPNRGQVELKASNRYKLESRPKEACFLDVAADSNTNYTTRAVRSAAKPDVNAKLTPRLRGVSPKSMTRPVAKIMSISKAGSTTSTVTTVGDHGLVSNQWVTIKGNRDQTNFANFSTPVQITVTGTTTFTCTIAGTGTATGYGGAVILTNGGVDQQGLLAQVIQSAAVDAAGTLTLVGSGSWSTGVGVMNVGDYMVVYGARSAADGSDMGIDGVWEVGNIATTSLELLPVTDIFGVRRTPVVGTITTTNCGGNVIHRTTLRVHDIVGEAWSESRTMIDGAGTDRIDKSLPVRILSGAVSSTVVGPAAHAANISGAPVRVGGKALTANVTAVATAQTVDFIGTTVGVQITKPYSLPEAEFQAIDSITNSTTAVQIKAALASNQNYVTGLTLGTETLGAAGELQIRSTPVASTTATIASNILVMAATYGWKVGDMVYVTASTVTGLTAGSYYYILTVSAANLTFSATRGGSTLSISGSSVNATLAKVMWRQRLLTTAMPVNDIVFASPVSGGINLAIEACTPTALTSGRIDINVFGYQAP